MKKLWCLGRFADSIPYILKIDENIEFEAFIKVSESLILERRRQKNHKGTDEEEGKVDVKVVSIRRDITRPFNGEKIFKKDLKTILNIKEHFHTHTEYFVTIEVSENLKQQRPHHKDQLTSKNRNEAAAGQSTMLDNILLNLSCSNSTNHSWEDTGSEELLKIAEEKNVALNLEIEELKSGTEFKVKKAIAVAIENLDPIHRHAIKGKTALQSYKIRNDKLMDNITKMIAFNLTGKESLSLNDKLLVTSASKIKRDEISLKFNQCKKSQGKSKFSVTTINNYENTESKLNVSRKLSINNCIFLHENI